MVAADKTFDLQSTNLYSHAATLTFWAFVEDNTKFGDKTFTVAYRNRIKIWVGSKNTNQVGVWCIPRPNFYKNIPNLTGKDLEGMTTKTQLEAQKADTEKNVLFAELAANKDRLWFNVKCAYTVIDKKNYLTLHQKDLAGVIKDGPKDMKVHNYIVGNQIDFPFRDFNPNNKIDIKNGGINTTSILIKNISAHIDYIPDGAHYEYFM
jgi:hypothetical protein